MTPAEWADVVDTLSDREMGTANPGMDTWKKYDFSHFPLWRSTSNI
jgi:hypothetical protein